ncbi:MAG: peptidoglycan-associated lipoprotein Pal [Candidatus Lambdaproteobacteria bacterium]|nr:peptidoglycan-associated lipoprotein Pal [Candidatus Lambdaproteobacteria bacterium]
MLRGALVTTLADQPVPPEFQLTLVAAEQQKVGDLGSKEFQPVFFDFDKYNIKPEFKAALEQNVQMLRGNPAMVVVIEGHCDERGTTEYNLALGERRANAVRNALIEGGIDGKRLRIHSWGEEKPVDPGHNEAAWAKNRRAIVVIQ